MERKEAYQFIKEHNLQAEVQRRFNQNYTRVCTYNLTQVCEEYKMVHQPKEEKLAKEEHVEKEPVKEVIKEPIKSETAVNTYAKEDVEAALLKLVATLQQKHILLTSEVNDILEGLCVK